MGRRFGAGLVGVDGRAMAVDHGLVDAVFDERSGVGAAKEARVVGLILGEKQGRVAGYVEIALAKRRMARRDRAEVRTALSLFQAWLGRIFRPGPGIAKPERRQHVQRCRLRPPVVDGDPDQDVLGRFLGVFHEDVEVAILVEDAGVEQFVLKVLGAARAVGLDQIVVGIGRLRIFVEVLHVGVGRRVVQVEIVLLDILAVVALAIGQAEETLLENRIGAVPQGQGEAELLWSSEMPASPSSPQR